MSEAAGPAERGTAESVENARALPPVSSLVASARPAARLSRRARKAIAWQGRDCQNCNTTLQGPFCHVCGQPERTPVRALVALGGDAFDYLFDVDSRLLRTLRDLFFRPGRLTEAYLRGQRMSFVRPLRIYIVISALLFVVVSSTSNFDDGDLEPGPLPTGPELMSLPADAFAPGPPAPKVAVTPPPRPDGVPPPAPKLYSRKPINLTIFDDQPWHAINNPLHIPALPQWANEQLNLFIGTVVQKTELARDNPKRLAAEFLRVLPQSMFVLLPIFALLLKLVLVFKRRLYMEHLMVAIHSHTFIFMGILVAIGMGSIASVWPTSWTNFWELFSGIAVAWIPINLFVMQKRVYRQSFFGALFCAAIIGTLYLFLLSFTALGALVLSLVNL